MGLVMVMRSSTNLPIKVNERMTCVRKKRSKVAQCSPQL